MGSMEQILGPRPDPNKMYPRESLVKYSKQGGPITWERTEEFCAIAKEEGYPVPTDATLWCLDFMSPGVYSARLQDIWERRIMRREDNPSWYDFLLQFAKKKPTLAQLISDGEYAGSEGGILFVFFKEDQKQVCDKINEPKNIDTINSWLTEYFGSPYHLHAAVKGDGLTVSENSVSGKPLIVCGQITHDNPNDENYGYYKGDVTISFGDKTGTEINRSITIPEDGSVSFGNGKPSNLSELLNQIINL